jgi:S1-C subfamily serine protease
MSSQRPPLVTCSPFALLFLLVALAAWIGWRWMESRRQVHDAGAAPRLVEARGDLAADEKAQIELFRNASPAVVHITTRQVAVDRFLLRAMEVPRGTGSGFVWDGRGYVVTNVHVLEGASRAFVTLDNQESYEAVLVGAEPSYDVAVLKIEPQNGALRAIPVGTSGDLQVGQKVFAIGNPFGLDHTLSTGVISGLNREIEAPDGSTIRGVIQTDAAINPGNSGGPLLDSAGRLIGMNTAIASPTGASAGIGFAVPVDTINRVVPSLIRAGRVERPRLGFRPASAEVARYLGAEGVVVAGVLRGGGAEQAGLRDMRFDARGLPTEADVITAVAGRRVRSIEEIWEVMEQHAVGDVVDVDVQRGDKKLRVQVKLSGGA